MKKVCKPVRLPKTVWKILRRIIGKDSFQHYCSQLIKKSIDHHKQSRQMTLLSSKLPRKTLKMIKRLGIPETNKALKSRLKMRKAINKRRASGHYKGRKYSLSVDNMHPTRFQHAVDAYMNRKNNGLTVKDICSAYHINVATFYNNLRHYKRTGELQHYQMELKTK